MKKVVKTQQIKTVNLLDVNSSKYYGVDTLQQRGFITMPYICHMPYVIKVLESVTTGNGFELAHPELQMLVDLIISRGWTVYEFDSAKELFTWLMEVEK